MWVILGKRKIPSCLDLSSKQGDILWLHYYYFFYAEVLFHMVLNTRGGKLLQDNKDVGSAKFTPAQKASPRSEMIYRPCADPWHRRTFHRCTNKMKRLRLS